MSFIFKKNSLKNIVESARKNNRAIGQFNFSSLDQLQGILRASKETKTPVICGTSVGEAEFFGKKEAALLVKSFRERGEGDVFLNFDHGDSFESVREAVDAGYDMVHFDGSSLPFDENIRETKKIVKYARNKKVLVEGEFSKIGGKSAMTEEKLEEVSLTSIEKVARFIRQTGVDFIALDVGNVHGVHAKMPSLSLERISKLLEITFGFVVLHGGSGVKEEEIKEAIKRGVVKININTELRVAWRNALSMTLEENKQETTPYKILPVARDAVYQKVKEKINLFNSTKTD